jgi:ADP-ribosylglycohydrolase
MLGAIAGDIFGAAFEGQPLKKEDFDLFGERRRFTDDTVMTVATAEALLGDGDYAAAYRRWGRRYPGAGYGGMFRHWIGDPERGPYNSFGNGSAMRVSPIGWAFATLDGVLAEAARSAAVSHDHPEGIKGAQAAAAAVFLARSGASQAEIRAELAGRFGYRLDRSIAAIRPDYRFDPTCQGSVPEALTAFLEAADFEHAIRLAISLGGDADTQAAIAGGAAEAFFGGVPVRIEAEIRHVLDPMLLEVVEKFRSASWPGVAPATGQGS